MPRRRHGPAARSTLKIVSKTGMHSFAVELATNDDERSRGLMFRKELPEGRGTPFGFRTRSAGRVFWMHNTYIRFDMIFIRGDGSILRIAENTGAAVGPARSLRRDGARRTWR